MQLARPLSAKSGIVSASSRFRQYAPETEQATRPVAVKPSDPKERLAMLRAMTPEQASSLLEIHRPANIFEALKIAKQESKVLVPHAIIDRILTETSVRLPLLRTGTSILYEEPDKPFQEKLTYNWNAGSVTFVVPIRFRGKTNCALAVDYPDFELMDLGNNNYEFRADEPKISSVPHFPKKATDWCDYSEWYSFDAQFRIPNGDANDYHESKRYLHRETTPYIGSLMHFVAGYYGRLGVNALTRPDDLSKIALF